MSTPAILALEDGSIFKGIGIGAVGESVGEVVFNTAMTGYQEILTDASYARQIVTLKSILPSCHIWTITMWENCAKLGRAKRNFIDIDIRCLPD